VILSLRSYIVLAAILTACGDPAGTAGGRATTPLEPTTRDSAGVALYEHPADALDRAPLITIDSTPLATFRGSVEDPASDISTIFFLTFTSVGDLVGYERTERQIVVLGTAPQSVTRFGKRGAGPLEIASGGAFTLLSGDTILFKDGVNNRLVLAHPVGGVIRTIPLAEVSGIMNAGPLGRLGDSTYLFSEHISHFGNETPQDGLAEQEQGLALWHFGADSVHQVATVPGYQLYRKVNPGSGRGGWTSVGYTLLLAGYTYLDAWDNQFVVAARSSWQVDRRGAEGRLTSSIRIPLPPRLADDALVTMAIEAAVASDLEYSPDANVDSLRESIAARPHADTVGVFESISPTPDGRLWLLDFRLQGADGWAATLINRDGRIVGRIVESTGDRPVAFGNDRLAFRSEDEDGIATITIRKLNVPPL
jgi:hypothetical protein